MVGDRALAERRNRALRAERDSLALMVSRYRARAVGSVAFEGEALESATSARLLPGSYDRGNPDIFLLRGDDLARRAYPLSVFTARGLVGVARGTLGDGASGDFWTHDDFRVSVSVEGGGASGLARPQRTEGGQPVLLLEGTPFQDEIELGSLLLTTGLGGVHPPGIAVGWVRAAAESEEGWMRRYVVEPAVWPQEVGHVLVWDGPAVGGGAGQGGERGQLGGG